MVEALTDRQTQILGALRLSITTNGYPPSVRELSTEIGVSTSTIAHDLAELERKGHIQRDPSKGRALVIVDDDPHQAIRAEAWEVGHKGCICKVRGPRCENPYEETK